LFACGLPSPGIDGPTDGILLTSRLHPLADRLIHHMATAYMPWLGKRFDARDARGENLLTNRAHWLMKLIWPLYSTGTSKGTRTAFEFETRVEAGRVEPRAEVLVLDYAAVERNPRLIIRSVRDELVEIVHGVHLGRGLWHQGGGRYTNVAYFALRAHVS
jgi:hypothetical protein